MGPEPQRERGQARGGDGDGDGDERRRLGFEKKAVRMPLGGRLAGGATTNTPAWVH